MSAKKAEGYLFLFFEGKDIPYYLPRIQRHYTGHYIPIKCKGKENVIGVYNLIKEKSEYNKYKKAYFIDRDFNSATNNIEIFETPCYSIENFYISSSVIKQILTAEFGISEVTQNPTFEAILSLYNMRLKEYHEAALLFNAWYSCLIENRERTGENTGVQLEEKFPKGFISFSLEKITAHYDLSVIKQRFPESVNILSEHLDAKVNEFKNCIAHLTFRGKYEMEFFLFFLKSIIDDSNSTRVYSKDKFRFSFSSGLTNDQALSIFSPYAETPDSLTNYIRQVINL